MQYYVAWLCLRTLAIICYNGMLAIDSKKKKSKRMCAYFKKILEDFNLWKF